MLNKLIITLIIMTMQSGIIFNFNNTADTTNWRIVDDVVMGGRSSGQFFVNENGHGVFKGSVSLDNNGGFSSLRYRFAAINTRAYSTVVLKVKGDGKTYQFRVKNNQSDKHSYITSFKSTTAWQTIEIPLSSMYPAFRGRTLRIPNYDGEAIEEIAFLIGNKKAEDFMLEIDSIVLK